MQNLTIKILVAEDDEASYQLIDASLKIYHYQIIRAKTGKEAVNLFKANPDIKIVLLDIQLPGMNGYEVLSEIKKINPDIPVIAQTAYSMIDDREKCLNAGCSEYISKPININRLRDVVYKTLL